MSVHIPPGVVHGGGGNLTEKPAVGTSSAGTGVLGQSNTGVGVWGQSIGNPTVGSPGVDGVLGDGRNGVHGRSWSTTDSGVWGENLAGGTGVTGSSKAGEGVVGQGGRNGVHGLTSSDHDSGVWGVNAGAGTGVTGTSAKGIGVVGQGGTLAGRFEGDVQVTGDVQLINQDCAEDFDTAGADKVEPGTVMVINQQGALQPCQRAYDKRVAGVISGAGGYKPAIILGKQQSGHNTMPIALLGKVYCKVDAQYSPIEVGDLLTTSSTPGHAMKATDPLSAFGAVIGKALRPIESGQGAIPILIALQ